MEEEKKKSRSEISAQKREFVSRLKDLLAKKYITSLHYEDTLVHDDGKAYVNVDLTKIDTPFAVFSYDKRLDPDIFDYIDTQVYFLRAAIPVVINFDDGGKYSEDLKKKIEKYVKRHYSLEYEDKRLEHRKTMIFASILMLVGIIMLALHFVSRFAVADTARSQVINEITLIMSWMFIWQSMDFFVVSGHTRRVDIYNSGQLALAEITFGKPKSN